MELTWPQIIMLNHASWVNSTRSEKKHESKKGKGKGARKVKAGPEVLDNKDWNELTPEEQAEATNSMMGNF